MELLECIDINKNYGDKKVLKNVNLKIPRGKIIGLLGKNGTGKSTLIKLINDLLTPTSGKILINGECVGKTSKKIISYLPERTYLDKSMTVSEVIKYFCDFYDNFDKEKALKLLNDLDLDIEQKLSKMSKGMQEKVQLVLVMSRKAELYIFVNPFAHSKGIGTKATRLLCKYAFENLKLKKVFLVTNQTNLPAQKVYEKVGFKLEGMLRKEALVNGMLEDRFYYGIFSNELVEL